MPEWVRVRLPNGGDVTMTARQAETSGLEPLSKPATSRDGQPLPFKPRTPKGVAVKPRARKRRVVAATTPPPAEAADASKSEED